MPLATARSALLVIFFIATLSHACIPTKVVEPGIPAGPAGPAEPACKKCAYSLINVDTTGANTKPFENNNMGTIDKSGACAVVTFVCHGSQIVLNIFEVKVMAVNGVATVSATCDGTAWQYDDNPITATVTKIGCYV